MGNRTISISRQFGSGGHEVAVKTADLLGIRVYERELIRLACEYGELSEKTLGIPVIAIGIPMVSDAATVADDVFSVMAEHIKESGGDELYKALSSIGESERAEVIKEVLTENEMNQVITPNNVDVISEQAAKIIAGGINLALHGDMFL